MFSRSDVNSSECMVTLGCSLEVTFDGMAADSYTDLEGMLLSFDGTSVLPTMRMGCGACGEAGDANRRINTAN
jgi:hypothetical protein